MHPPKSCKLHEGIMLIFVSEKNRPLLLAKVVYPAHDIPPNTVQYKGVGVGGLHYPATQIATQ